MTLLQFKFTLQKTHIQQEHEQRVLDVKHALMKWQSHSNKLRKFISQNLLILSQLTHYVNVHVEARKLFYNAHILSYT